MKLQGEDVESLQHIVRPKSEEFDPPCWKIITATGLCAFCERNG